jgi:peptide/nickel transport system substrate-binding protein
MRQQLNEAGFDVGIEQVTTSTYWERYEKGEYDTTVAGNAVDLDPDPALYLFFYSRGEGGVFNWVSYDSEEANGFMKKQRRLVEQSARKPVLHDLEDLIVADAPHAYTHHPKPYFAISEDVKGYKPHPVNRDFHTVWLDS